MNSVYDTINDFCYKRSQISYTDTASFYKLRDDFLEKIKVLKDAESEILNYYNNSIITGVWENEMYWAWAAITRPSHEYLKCFSKVLQTNNDSFPYWRTLDALAFMPKEWWPECACIIKAAIELDNPSWSDDDMNMAFEALRWITDDGGIQFNKEKCNNQNDRIARIARYWLFWPDGEDFNQDDE